MLLRYFRSLRERRRRQIFRFHDGRAYRSIDPIIVSMRLNDDPEYLPRHLDEAIKGDAEAAQICSNAATRAFDLIPLDDDGNGLPITDQVTLLRFFENWVAALKKNMTHSVV